MELELDEEKRRHSETIKILRKKERQVKEVLIQSEEDQKNVSLLQESLDKLNQRVSIYKRQLQEQVSWSKVKSLPTMHDFWNYELFLSPPSPQFVKPAHLST